MAEAAIWEALFFTRMMNADYTSTATPKVASESAVTGSDADVILKNDGFTGIVQHTHPRILFLAKSSHRLEEVYVAYRVKREENGLIGVRVAESAQVWTFHLTGLGVDPYSIGRAHKKTDLSKVLVDLNRPVISYGFEKTKVNYNPRARLLGPNSLVISDAGTALTVRRDAGTTRFVVGDSIEVSELKGVFRAERFDPRHRATAQVKRTLVWEPYRSYARDVNLMPERAGKAGRPIVKRETVLPFRIVKQ